MFSVISKSKNPKPHLVDALSVIEPEYKPHQFAHVLAQVMHESAGLQYDREIWGPTAAQKRYEGRKDLGNTQPGDGSKYRGYGPIQVTGRYNVTEFYNWCKKQGLNPPDFVARPELIAASPWAGWSIVWYWSTRNLNRYADTNDIEMITRRVNGGLNGYADRLDYYDRSALVLLGYGPRDIRKFQVEAGILADGISGPKTRAALHAALVKAGNASGTKPAPVTAAPPSLEKPWYQSKEIIAPVATSVITTVTQALTDLPWQNLLIFAVVGLVAYLLWSRQRDKRSIVQ